MSGRGASYDGVYLGSMPSERSSQLRAASKLLVDADESRADFCTVQAVPAYRE